MNKKLFLLICLLITACTQNNGISARFSINSANYLNPDIDGKASPVVINFYELKTPFEFKQVSFKELNNNASTVLGTNLLDKQSYETQPGEKHIITQWLTNNTRYIGISAAYRNIDTARWRSIIKIPHQSKKIKVLVNLQSQSLNAKLIK